MKKTRKTLLLLFTLVLCLNATVFPAFAEEEKNAYLPRQIISESNFNSAVFDAETGDLISDDGISSNALTYSSIRTEGGNQYLHVPFQGTAFYTNGNGGSGNFDRAAQLKHKEISHETTAAVVIEMDFRIHYVKLTEGTGEDEDKIYCGYEFDGGSPAPTSQIQFKQIKALKEPGDAEATVRAWGGVTTVNLQTGAFSDVSKLESAQPLKQDTWTRLRFVITLKTGAFSLYTDDVLYGHGKLGNGVGDFTILENTLLVGKCNKQPGAYKTHSTEFVEKTDSYDRPYLIEAEKTATDTSEDISYVDIDNVLFRHVDQIPVTLDGKPVKVPENEDLTLAEEGKTLLFADVKNGNEHYITEEKSIVPVAGMQVNRFLLGNMKTTSEVTLRAGVPAGIRFTTVMEADDLERFLSQTDYTIRIGTIITQAHILDSVNGRFDKESLSVYGNGDVLLSKNYAEVLATPSKPYEDRTEEDGTVVFAGSLANIRYGNINTDYVGRGFFEILDENGTVVQTVYADYEENATSFAASVEEYLKTETAGKNYLQSLLGILSSPT